MWKPTSSTVLFIALGFIVGILSPISPLRAGSSTITLAPGDSVTVVAATLPPTPSPTPTSLPSPSPTPAIWKLAVDDEFTTAGLPAHWSSYNGKYGSGTHNCAVPSQTIVNGDGLMHMVMSYLPSGPCGAAWYTAGMKLVGFSGVDARITLRYRVVSTGAFHSHFIMPMRWPDLDSSWPAAGEEDYVEGNVGNLHTYLHYGSTNAQVASPAYALDVTQWHTIQTTRLNHVVTVAVDGVALWTYSNDSTTLPDTSKHVVLQQECLSSGCPSGTTGTEDIQVDWITVENPA